MSKEDLLDSIEELYGFKREQIKNPELCGCFYVDFEVNGILYSGSVAFHGAAPQLWIRGYTAKHHNAHGTPVENWYYEEFIKGKPARLLRCVDLDAGAWEDTGIKFKNQGEAEEYMNNLDKNTASNFQYEMIND